MLHDGEPEILRPFHRSEALSIAQAAFIANKSKRTVREWAQLHDLGRRIGGQWVVSKVALAMWLDGNKDALSRYLTGDRSSPTITHYFEQYCVALPCNPRRRIIGTQYPQESRTVE
jgi:Helix-turn-helix domain